MHSEIYSVPIVFQQNTYTEKKGTGIERGEKRGDRARDPEQGQGLGRRTTPTRTRTRRGPNRDLREGSPEQGLGPERDLKKMTVTGEK